MGTAGVNWNLDCLEMRFRNALNVVNVTLGHMMLIGALVLLVLS